MHTGCFWYGFRGFSVVRHPAMKGNASGLDAARVALQRAEKRERNLAAVLQDGTLLRRRN